MCGYVALGEAWVWLQDSVVSPGAQPVGSWDVAQALRPDVWTVEDAVLLVSSGPVVWPVLVLWSHEALHDGVPHAAAGSGAASPVSVEKEG